MRQSVRFANYFGPQWQRCVRMTGAAAMLGLLALAGCSTFFAYGNEPLAVEQEAPDCRATVQIAQPRGEKDVLVILCLSGGGSRAAWMSAATMLRLERVVDEVNLLHEVDVISSVSGSSLTSAYYCATRDPGAYSVVRVEQLPESLPADLAMWVKMDRQRGLLGMRGKMSDAQRERLLALMEGDHDRECVERLYWLSHHTRAPEVWRADRVREVLTRNYTQKLVEASFSPLNFWDDCLYWTTGFDRSDQLAKIFARNLYGAGLLQDKAAAPSGGEEEMMGGVTGSEALRWPDAPPEPSRGELDWIPGYAPARQASAFIGKELVGEGVREASKPLLPWVPYQFKDLNPERPYLILNATSASEDDPDGLRFGEVFTFTREDFSRHLNSAIAPYDLAHGVVASAAFPGAFPFVTLRDYRPGTPGAGERYLHVFDGGTADNMGLTSAKRIILANHNNYRHIVVVMVDAHVPFAGASRTKPDPRDKVVDLNFLNSFETLLDSVRQRELDEFESLVVGGHDLSGKMTFWHITFDDVRDEGLRAKAYRLPTRFDLSKEDVEVVDRCVEELVRPATPKVREMVELLGVRREVVEGR